MTALTWSRSNAVRVDNSSGESWSGPSSASSTACRRVFSTRIVGSGSKKVLDLLRRALQTAGELLHDAPHPSSGR